MAMTATTLVQRYLIGDYPATRDELVARARSQGADEQSLAVIRNLRHEQFDSATAVIEAVGQGWRQRAGLE